MVRVDEDRARAAQLKRRAAQKKRKDGETGGDATLSEGLLPSIQPTDVSSAGDLPDASASLPLVLVDAGQAVSAGEEEEEAEPPLKRKRLVRLGDLERSEKGKGKVRTVNHGQWESVLKLAKDATAGDLDVSRYLAEKIILPVDEEMMEKKSALNLGSQLVRLGVRTATMSLAVLQHLETLDQEVQNLHEQTKTSKDKLLEVEEGKDFLQAQNASLEEEKRSLLARLAEAEKEREMERMEREKEVAEWRKTVRMERELNKQLHIDCRSAMVGRDRAEKTLAEVRQSVRKQRIEAIKRWKTRFLYEESLELACDMVLRVLRRGHELYTPEGSACPSFEDYAGPLIPEVFGLSLEEMAKQVEGEPRDVPDEELDLSSEEEGSPYEDVPSVAPSATTPVPIELPSEEEGLPNEGTLSVAPMGPVPLPLETSPEHPPASEYSPGYTPSPPANT